MEPKLAALLARHVMHGNVSKITTRGNGATLTFGVKVIDRSKGAAVTRCVRYRAGQPDEMCGRKHTTAAAALRCAKRLAKGVGVHDDERSHVAILPYEAK